MQIITLYVTHKNKGSSQQAGGVLGELASLVIPRSKLRGI